MTTARLLALDLGGLRGAVVRARAGPARDLWLDTLRAALPSGAPVRRLPPGIEPARLSGALDIAATLAAGRPVAERGLIAEAERGVLIAPMAERLGEAVIAQLIAVLDHAGPALVLLDEGGDDEAAPRALVERLAFHLDLEGVRPGEANGWGGDEMQAHAPQLPLLSENRDPALAGELGPHLRRGTAWDAAFREAVTEPLCATAAAFGIDSMRAPLLAVRAARAAAALGGRTEASEEDVLLAARLVLAPRATRLPAPNASDAVPEAEQEKGSSDDADTGDSALADRVVEATRAALPPGIMAALAAGAAPRRAATGGRGAGKLRRAPHNGRRAGARAGSPRDGARLDLIETLRAAALWQALRRRDAPSQHGILVRRDDFRVRRLVRRAGSTTIFVVDASGSAALARLGEAKGAVELLLAEAYVRRDEVALIAFRGTTAELLLPPTRSLARAKRCLADLAGGGGTPLAAAIEQAALLAGGVRAKGRAPLILFLTDARANVARDGATGAPRALADAETAARVLAAEGIAAVFLDTAQRARPEGRRLAEAMHARYLALPRVAAEAVCDAVRAAR